MPVAPDQDHRATGTRFKLYPQAPVLASYSELETVWISERAGAIRPGPADDRMYVVDPVNKPQIYEFPYLPPFRGAVRVPVAAGPNGHFDHLRPGDPGFAAAHMYGTIRRVLDIWEGYFGRSIPWHFSAHFDRLELIPIADWDNAQSGYGFIEVGFGETEAGERHPYALNFDVLAHELGHSIIFSEVGVPNRMTTTAAYRGFQESASDLVALVAALHFDTVVDRLLEKSKGNLYTLNELNRIGELSETEQVRTASNMFRMSDVADVTTPPDALSQHELHRLGEPLTGAIFDIFVEVYQDILLDAGLIDAELAALSDGALQNAEYLTLVERRFAVAYQNRHDAFKACLLQARDYLGILLANTWMRVPVHFLTFRDVSSALLVSDSAIAGASYSHLIRDSLAWREISAPDIGEARDSLACQCAACQQRRSSDRRTRPHRHLPYSERWSLATQGHSF